VQLAANIWHTCALLNTGNVRCWGEGRSGSLGYGNTNTIGDDESAASAGDVNVGGTVTQIAAGGGHTCAILSSGAVRCWGGGVSGALGYANTNSIGDDERPVQAGDVDVGGKVVQITTGTDHTCALLDTGAVRCWGGAVYGRLGYGNTNAIGDNETPASAGNVNVGGTVVQISAGVSHTCALLDTGTVRCWGQGEYGRLGYGNTNAIGDDEPPAAAGDVNVGGTVTQIAAGGAHTCALLSTGKVRCWGEGTSGLGYGNVNSIGDDENPASAGDLSIGGTAVKIATGRNNTCALLDTGVVRCWGSGQFGKLGYGNQNNIGDNELPASAGDVSLGGSVLLIAAGIDHNCVLLRTAGVQCWGSGGMGRLGYGNTNNIGDDETPASAGTVPLL
jgi:alpha-tubulin suppressor-like RCC1 family protein